MAASHRSLVIALIVASRMCDSASAEDAADVIERVKRSVVYIERVGRDGQTLGHASGFSVAPGIIATNVHVLEDASKFVVIRSDGKWCVGRGIWSFDRRNDIALVQLSNSDNEGNIPPLKLATKESVKTGIPVFVLGNPENLKFSVTNGIISAVGRHSKEISKDLPGCELIQTDAPTLPGSSGGPWVNSSGEVVAVHRSGYGIGGEKEQGFNFGASVEHLEKLLSYERKKILPIDHFSGEETLTRSWRVIVPPETKPMARIWYSPVTTLPILRIGPDRNEVPDLKINGTWNLDGLTLVAKSGSTTAVSFGVADDFTFEGQVELGREGGCFWLVGWNEDSGYIIRDPGLRKSAHWMLAEIKAGKFVPGSNVTLSNTRVTGKQTVAISVVEGRLSFHCGPAKTAKPVELPNYREGSLILGNYPSGYGPRPLRVFSARIKAN